ncbi:Protein of unknown function [Micromonospora nigra]|uniref:DUF742 domain-containing protein n=1 Tax=Micromonospora nigra TaxID=145857 RepID=A0A1C6REH3_9ACTN|nr:DUF742 domain-containing protein [Micromonospora nigra]SCL15468.1 Protein of unknown function [Micromonospora nigra]
MTGPTDPDDEAGPVVRPYAVTGGRARPVVGVFDLISLVTATGAVADAEVALGPEHRAIVQHCRLARSVAEIAAHLDLPLGTVRVLLGDLAARDLIRVQEPWTPAGVPDTSIFEAVIDGLRAL